MRAIEFYRARGVWKRDRCEDLPLVLFLARAPCVSRISQHRVPYITQAPAAQAKNGNVRASKVET